MYTHLNKCKGLHTYRLVPIKPGSWSFQINANFNQSTGFNDTQHAIIVNISNALSKYGVVVLVACYAEINAKSNLLSLTLMKK